MKPGSVALVGAGPGDPGLLTVRGLQLLRKADVIVYDQLVNPALLEEASPLASRVFVGKQAGCHCIAQAEINEVLIGCAGLGHEVLRLKGGDPFVFGRGGEEAEALADAGIPFEIVPGVSSAVAVPAYAGIPLTHRKFASSFAVVTGHETRKAQSSINWAKLATAVDTLVILMGLGNLPIIVANLLKYGRAANTSAAVIRMGTTGEQETVLATLADIVEKSAAIEAPALIVVGDVVSLADKLQWFFPHRQERLLYGTENAAEVGSETMLCCRKRNRRFPRSLRKGQGVGGFGGHIGPPLP
jgi:uroporphyrinogen III methyltransferase/synthase